VRNAPALGEVSASRRRSARAGLAPRPKPAMEKDRQHSLYWPALVPEGQRPEWLGQNAGSVNPEGKAGLRSSSSQCVPERSDKSADLSEASCEGRDGGRAGEGPAGVALCPSPCLHRHAKAPPLLGRAPPVKHGHRSMEAGLGRGILRGGVLVAPPGLPAGAMERTRGGERGPDLIQPRREPVRARCAIFPTRERTLPRTVRTLHEQGKDPSQPGNEAFRLGNGPFTSKDRGGCTLGMYPSRPRRGGTAPWECTFHDQG
jgi:hypothetical protein